VQAGAGVARGFFSEGDEMRARRLFAFTACTVWATAAVIGTANAASITDPNLFSLQNVNSTSPYSGDFAAANAVDGQSSNFIFTDSGDWYLNVNGFDSNVHTLRFFDGYGVGDGGQRASNSVSIYYSNAANTSLATGDYTFLKKATLATASGDPNTQYTLTGTDGTPYAEVSNLGIPTGTKSVLLKFGPQATTSYGPALTEVQGFATARVDDDNVLRGKSVAASSAYTSSAFNAAYATDGTNNQNVFADFNAQQSLAIRNIGAGFDTIRIWRDTTEDVRVPARVLVKSSSSDLTDEDCLNASKYETELTNLSSLTFNSLGYADIAVNAGANTQNLFLDFGIGDALGTSYGVRVVEVQAFNLAVPEPSSIAIVACGAFGLLAYAWRKRK
jgi:hypothetical protein